MTELIPFDTSDKIYDHLLSYDKEYIINGITKFLNEEQRKDLLDSLEREVF
jgi:hypothetical protein